MRRRWCAPTSCRPRCGSNRADQLPLVHVTPRHFQSTSDLRSNGRSYTQAVVDGLGCRHPVIPVGVLADPLDRLSGLGGDDLAQSLAHLDDLARLDVDVRCWALYAAHRLMQQEACVRQAEAEPLLAGRIDERAGRGHPAGTDHVDRHAGTHKLDDVMDRVTRLDMTSRRIDIDLD